MEKLYWAYENVHFIFFSFILLFEVILEKLIQTNPESITHDQYLQLLSCKDYNDCFLFRLGDLQVFRYGFILVSYI